jgi:peptidoglycan hydrolase-like protein with peptidoglycan-binding domain
MNRPSLKLTLPNMTGPEVLELQKALGELNYTIPADGVYGIRTQNAVKAYQARAGLEVNGECDQAVWDALGLGGEK